MAMLAWRNASDEAEESLVGMSLLYLVCALAGGKSEECIAQDISPCAEIGHNFKYVTGVRKMPANGWANHWVS